MGRIVVGVDASADARNALEWAAAEARLRRSAIQVVHAYHAHGFGGYAGYAPTEHVASATAVVPGEPLQQDLTDRPDKTASLRDRATVEDLARSDAEQLLETAIRKVREALTGVEVHRVVIEDRHPAEALLELSTDADLLVVGSRGHGGFSQLVLGSVSHAVVLHAACPVVVVPPRRA